MYYTKTAPIIGTILYKVDGDVTVTFPPNLDNTDYQQYLKWVAEGNEPIPVDEGVN
jgi:hypothetical protein